MTSRLILPLLVCAAFAQSGPSFEAADVHISPRSNSFNMNLRGPFARPGRYEIRTASMLDLIGIAYSMDTDRVYGGPNWLEMDRYDVIGKPPAGATPEAEKRMLQRLLADRFHLVLHQDHKELPVYLMTAGKHPQVSRAADAPGDRPPGCAVQFKPAPNGGASSDGSPPPAPQYEIICKAVTMERFADDLRNNLPITNQYLHNKPVVDRTGLEGAWDFRFTLSLPPRAIGGSQNSDSGTFSQVLEQQTGLRLEPGKASLPVLQVDKVDREPSPNAPEISTLLAGSAAPAEFEVASIKPTDPSFQGTTFDVKPGGRVDIKGASLRFLIRQIWQIFDDNEIAGAPKWLGDDRWDIVAKSSSLGLSHGGPNTPGIDMDAVMVMVKNLLAQRFKLATHRENRDVSAYNLVAVKPKMKPADPQGRIKCFEGPGPDGKDPRDSNPVLGRLLTCQNMTMDRLAEMLWGLAPVYIHSPVLNQTSLQGSWDFTLSFSFAAQLQNEGRGGDAGAGDPNGALSLPNALLKQLGLKLEAVKRPVPVLVIDNVEQKPIEN